MEIKGIVTHTNRGKQSLILHSLRTLFLIIKSKLHTKKRFAYEEIKAIKTLIESMYPLQRFCHIKEQILCSLDTYI